MADHISETWVTTTSIRVDAGIVVRGKSSVSSIARAGVLTRPIVVARSIGITLVGLIVCTWEDLSTGSAAERVSSIARAVIRVGARIAARAQAISTWSPSTVIHIGAVHTIATISAWTGVTAETLCRCRLVMAGHSSEAWVPSTSIRVGASCAISTVSIIACTAVPTRSIVVARSVGITGVRFRVFTRKDLGAGPTTERVSIIACTVERVGTGVAAGAARTTRCTSTVVDIGAVHTIAVGTGWTGTTCERSAFNKSSGHITADHTSEARFADTAICIKARRAIPTVTGITRAVIRVWASVAAYATFSTRHPRTVVDVGACASRESVSAVTGAVIVSVGTTLDTCATVSARCPHA